MNSLQRKDGRVCVLAAPDKFRGSATASQVAGAIAAAVTRWGGDCVEVPLADGGEGTLEAFGGANRTSVVAGPLGSPVAATWRLDGDLAVIEMATASGLALLDPLDRDPLLADSTGTGELIRAAASAGARRIIVGVGGSASTDGGLGAVSLLASLGPLDGRQGRPLIEVACDVDSCFVDAARLFGPQKGATATQVAELTARLERLADDYRARFGRDVTTIPGSGAAGGLAGGLAALGARLRSGFDVVAEQLGLAGHVAWADLVITGEGRLDAQSFSGKVVGSMSALAAGAHLPCLAVVGSAAPDLERTNRPGWDYVALVDRFGDRAFADPLGCIESVATGWLESRPCGIG